MPVSTTAESPTCFENEYALKESRPEAGIFSNLEEDFHAIDQEEEDMNKVITNQHDEEVAIAKLKLIIRLWKRWSSRQSELRERRQLAAASALNSLSLGPPICFNKTDHSFDIDQSMRRRFEEHKKIMVKAEYSDVVADKCILVGRNPDSKCISWKVFLCTQTKSVNTTTYASRWLLTKLVPHTEHKSLG